MIGLQSCNNLDLSFGMVNETSTFFSRLLISNENKSKEDIEQFTL